MERAMVETATKPASHAERGRKGGKARTTTDYHIRKLVDGAPPLSQAQRDELSALVKASANRRRNQDGGASE